MQYIRMPSRLTITKSKTAWGSKCITIDMYVYFNSLIAMKRQMNKSATSNRSNLLANESIKTKYDKFCSTLRLKKYPQQKFEEVQVRRVVWSKEENKFVVSDKPTIIRKPISLEQQNANKESEYIPISQFIVPIQISPMHKKIVLALLPKLNDYLKTSFLSLRLDSILGQYVHTNWFLYYLTASNSKKITASVTCYGNDDDCEPFYLNIAKIGRIDGLKIQQQLIKIDNWPSCGAYHRQSPDDICDGNIVNEYIDQINKKVGIIAERWDIIRAWTQIVCGTNYMFHLTNEKGEKASVGIYVNFDGCGGMGEEDDEEEKMGDDEGKIGDDQESVEIWGSAKGHVRMDQLQSHQNQQ